MPYAARAHHPAMNSMQAQPPRYASPHASQALSTIATSDKGAGRSSKNPHPPSPPTVKPMTRGLPRHPSADREVRFSGLFCVRSVRASALALEDRDHFFPVRNRFPVRFRRGFLLGYLEPTRGDGGGVLAGVDFGPLTLLEPLSHDSVVGGGVATHRSDERFDGGGAVAGGVEEGDDFGRQAERDGALQFTACSGPSHYLTGYPV